MGEKIIKWSSKKIIWTILLCLVELAFLLWILSFMMTYPKEAPVVSRGSFYFSFLRFMV